MKFFIIVIIAQINLINAAIVWLHQSREKKKKQQTSFGRETKEMFP